MFDAAKARRFMVDGQVRTADVTNPDLIAAMLDVPRERFVPPQFAEQAYLDGDIEIGKGRALMRPMILAKLIQAAGVGRGDHVLDVGCGLGYSAAILSRLAASVVAVEQDEELAAKASKALAAIGAGNVSVVKGALTAGAPPSAPYDVIFLNGATEIVPESLGGQLQPDGRLAGIFGRSPATQGTIFYLVEDRLVGRPAFDAAGVILPGFEAPPVFVF